MSDEWWPEGYVNPAFTVQRERFGTAVGGDYVRAHPGYKHPAYITPTTGAITIPDPGPLPAQCTFVFRVRGPTQGTGEQVIVGQTATGQHSFSIRRFASTVDEGHFSIVTSNNGTAVNAVTLTQPSPILPDPIVPVADQQYAIALDFSASATARLWQEDGAWKALGAAQAIGNVVPFDSNALVRIGSQPDNTLQWNGRIYSVELLTGLDPDADERYFNMSQGIVSTPDTSDMDFTTPMLFTWRAQFDRYGTGFPSIITKEGGDEGYREYLIYGYAPVNNRIAFSTGAPGNTIDLVIAEPTPMGAPHTFGVEIIPGSSMFTSIVDGVRTTVDTGSPIIPPDNYAPLILGSPQTFGRLYWAQLERLDDQGHPTGVVWRFNADEAPRDPTTTSWVDFRGRRWTVSNPQAISGRSLWRFDANEYPGTGTSYVDPRGHNWTLTNASAITPAATVSGITTLAQTALRYPSTVPGFDAARGKAYLAIRPWLRLPPVVYKGTVKDDYGSAQIAWGWPVGLEEKWEEVVLVRSGFGDPTTVNDGETVFSSPKDGYLDEDGKLTLPAPVIIDQPLQAGQWYYYSLFFRTSQLDWVLGMTGNVQIPRDYHHAEHLWNAIPPYYQYADANIREGNGFLQQILGVFGYELDTTRQYVESWQECYHIDKVPVPLLKRVGENFGEPYKGGIGAIRYRGMIAALPEALSMRGTSQAMQQVIEASSKWLCEISIGSNLMLLPDDSDMGHGTGSWGTMHPETDNVDIASSLPPTDVILLRNPLSVSGPPPGYGRNSMRLTTLKAYETASLCITCGSALIIQDPRRIPNATVTTSHQWEVRSQGLAPQTNVKKGTGRVNVTRIAAATGGIGGKKGAWYVREIIPLYAGIPVDERVTYGFSVQVKMEIPSDVLPLIYWFGPTGQPGGLISRSSGIEASPTTTNWTSYNVTGTTPLGAVYLVPALAFNDRPTSGVGAQYSPWIDIAGAMVYRLGSQGAVTVNPPDSYLTLGEPTEIIGDKEAPDAPPEFTEDYWMGSASTTGLPPIAPT